MTTLHCSNPQCVIVGEGSIVTHIATLLLERELEIKGVFSRDHQVIQYARRHNIAVFDADAAMVDHIQLLQYDLLLSVGNNAILPAAVVEKPNTLAINAHDGPLERLVGFYTPMWALLEGASSHQVHWHQMSAKPYAGPSLIAQNIAIDPDESAMTLNAKCFSAVLGGLTELLDQLQSNTLTTTSPVKTEAPRYISNTARPAAFGLLDPQASLALSLRQSRALFTGHYENPLTSAKLLIGQHIYLCNEAQALPNTGAQHAIGEILPGPGETVMVQWSDGLLQVELLKPNTTPLTSDQRSQLLGQAIVSPQTLQPLLNQVAQHFGQFESYWLEQLDLFAPLTMPYIELQTSPTNATTSQPLLTDLSAKQGLYITCAWLARICDCQHVSLPIIFADDPAKQSVEQQLQDQLGALRQSWQFSFDYSQSLQLQFQRWQLQFDILQTAGPCAADLVARHPQLSHWAGQVQQPMGLLFSSRSDAELKQALACLNEFALLFVYDALANSLRVISNGELIKPLGQIAAEIQWFAEQSQSANLSHISLITPTEASLLSTWSQGPSHDSGALLMSRFAQAVNEYPEHLAVVHRDTSLSFSELAQQVNQVSRALIALGVQPGEFVGIMMARGIELLPALLGTMAMGAACVPMDPLYPADRLEYVSQDAKLDYIICLSPHLEAHFGAEQIRFTDLLTKAVPATIINPAADALAYMLYTSGSSGKPKGVMVEHQNLANFFLAMDERVPMTQQDVWLAVTSISFDISLLELLWTLVRGVKIVLYDGQDLQSPAEAAQQTTILDPNSDQDAEQALQFGLFYWNIANEADQPGPHQYELLLEGAKYADSNGFSSIWTPERHFGDFGGLYPNPAVTSAAVAAITHRIGIRAGSCVFPLHHPIRIAEDWAIIDNISNGRVGLSAAAGWMPNDFVLQPDNHANAKTIMFDSIDQVSRLWRGETVTFPGPKGPVAIKTLPRPVQSELPLWITIGGNPDNFTQAGQMGKNVLTHLLGQTIEELAPKIQLYRDAWQAAGHPGQGQVSVMLHTFVADTDAAAKEIARAPMKNYLKTALFLVKAAAWDWPLFKKMSEDQGKTLDEFFSSITDEDMDALLDFAFERYFTTAGLFGSVASAANFAAKLKKIGVTELGCLIDYGIDNATVLEHLPMIKQVMDLSQQQTPIARYGVAALMARHQVTHLQLTPSMARLFLSDEAIVQQLKSLHTLLIGGEALPLDLAKQLKGLIQGPLLNMYGPTETTIWSSVDTMAQEPNTISLGQPLINTQLTIVDQRRQPLPIGAIGELLIGGAGVVRGYWQRPALTDERFLPNQPAYTTAERVYATGDLARFMPDQRLLFLGRNDFQVKVRGYRIELGEIETLLLTQPGIDEAIVHPVVYGGAEPRLVAYYTPKHSAEKATEQGHFQATNQALKAALAEQLPPFMVPNVFIQLERFPLTPNAKIDRNALPVPQTNAPQSSAIATDGSELEIQVLHIWHDILGRQDIGLTDNFFDFGGHSLLVVDVMTKLKPLFNQPIKLIDLFRYPRVRDLVKHLSGDTLASDQAKIEAAQSRGAARRAARRRT